MRTENGLEIDYAALDQLLTGGDLIAMGFTLFPKRLLVDTRSNATDGQYVSLVDPVATVQERYMWLGKHRGSFGTPQGFGFFVWPHTVRGLLERDALAPLRARLTPEASLGLDRALAEALELERQAMAAAVRGGEQWPAIWQAGPHAA